MRWWEGDQHDDVLVVRRGRVEGVDVNQSKFSADVTGAVNCRTGQLLRSGVERGTYADVATELELGFSGAAKGEYTTDPPALAGTWNIIDDTTLLAGQGSWSTSLSEPL